VIHFPTVALKAMGLEEKIWLYLWAGPHLLLAPIAILMFRRKLYKDFPIFFAYLIFEFLQFCLLFPWHFRPTPLWAYAKADLVLRAGSTALRFGILRDLFEAPVLHNPAVRRTMAPVLHGATFVLVVAALALVGTLYFSDGVHSSIRPYLTVQALNTAQCGLLVLAFLWHRFLGVRMSPFFFGVALGVGLITGSEPLLHALRASSAAVRLIHTVDFAQMGIYHIAVLVWLYYVLVRDNIKQEFDGQPPQLTGNGGMDEMGRMVQL